MVFLRHIKDLNSLSASFFNKYNQLLNDIKDFESKTAAILELNEQTDEWKKFEKDYGEKSNKKLTTAKVFLRHGLIALFMTGKMRDKYFARLSRSIQFAPINSTYKLQLFDLYKDMIDKISALIDEANLIIHKNETTTGEFIAITEENISRIREILTFLKSYTKKLDDMVAKIEQDPRSQKQFEKLKLLRNQSDILLNIIEK